MNLFLRTLGLLTTTLLLVVSNSILSRVSGDSITQAQTTDTEEQKTQRAEAERLNNLSLQQFRANQLQESIALSEANSSMQQEELAKAEKLDQQIEKLYQQGKYNEAIPLAEQALAIRKKVLGDKHLDTATSLNNLAGLYKFQGRYAEAESLYQQALSIFKEQLGDKHLDTATSLNNLVGLYSLQGRYAEAEPLYQQALAIYREQLGDQHPSTALSLDNLAGLYQSQGRYTEAESRLKEALAIYREQLGDQHPSTARGLNNLAGLYQSQGKYTEAESLYQQALAIRKKQLGDKHPDTAQSLNNLAGLYQSQGRYTEAESHFKQALAITKEQLGDKHPKTAQNLNDLATLYRDQGRYAEAELLLKQALAIAKEQLGDKHPDTASSLNNLAFLYQSQGRYVEAEPLLKEALAIYEERLGDQHPNTAQSLDNLARLYQSQERYTEAELLFKQALAIRKKQLGDKHPKTAQSFNNLAGLYSLQGRYAEAEPLYQEALAIKKEQLGDRHPDTATSLNNLALLYQSQEKYAEAELFYQKALAVRIEQLGDQHPDTAQSLGNLAGLYYSQGDLSRAIKYLTKGLGIQEYNLSKNLISGDEQQKQDYMATVLWTTDFVISLNLQSAPNNPEATRLALTTILERKGRILDVLTNSLQILRERTDDPESQELLTQFIDIRTQYANLTFKKPGDFPSPEVYRQQLEELNTKAKQFEDQLSRHSVEFRDLSQPITLEAIQKLIPSNSALVEIVRYRPLNPKATKASERRGKPRYAVYILRSQGDPQAIDLGEAETIEQALIDFRNNLQDQDTPIEQLKQSARQLDERLMKPVRQLLGDTRTILLSPDAALNLIPFEALVDENDRYLVETHHFTYLTSGRDLLRLQNKASSQQPPIVLADPLYSQKGEVVALDATRSINLSQMSFSRLAGTAEEAKAIAQLFPNARVLTSSQATENILKQVNRPAFLHLATHGFFLEASDSQAVDNPLLRSGLVLAGVKVSQSAGDDGILTALEATTLDLVGTKLVVLSACDTGVGDVSAGEGIYGLRRALVLAGSESQLISLWKVDDAATKDLIVDYYKRLKDNEGRSEALRRIQLEMLQGKQGEKYQHPYFWASFIPSGDWTPIQFTSAR